MVDETVSETCRVAYATVCERCESVLHTEVREEPYAAVADKHLKDGGKSFFVYHDKLHRSLFRSIVIEPGSCRLC